MALTAALSSAPNCPAASGLIATLQCENLLFLGDPGLVLYAPCVLRFSPQLIRTMRWS